MVFINDLERRMNSKVTMFAADQKLDRKKRSLTKRLLEDFTLLRNWVVK